MVAYILWKCSIYDRQNYQTEEVDMYIRYGQDMINYSIYVLLRKQALRRWSNKLGNPTAIMFPIGEICNIYESYSMICTLYGFSYMYL